MRWWGEMIRGRGVSCFLQRPFHTRLIRWFPGPIFRGYLHLLGRLYYGLNGQEKEEIRENLCTILTRLEPSISKNLAVTQTFRGILSHYYEKLFIAYAPFDRVCRSVDQQMEIKDRHLLDEALALKRGLILVTAHFGAVEFLPLLLALKGYPVTMVVRFRSEQLKRAQQQRADAVGVKLLDPADGPSVAFAALQALKANRILITQCDEFTAWRPLADRLAPFLGFPCPVDRTLDLLRRRYKSAVVMGLACRDGNGRYQLPLHALVGSGEESVVEGIGQRALGVLETYIRATPEQWYQWRKVRMILGTHVLEEREPVLAVQRTRTAMAGDSNIPDLSLRFP
jgi:KDO2-lipid IV(A) lauroyltransferase